MTTYVYESIPQQAGEKPRYFEIKQNKKDPPLTKHPETGEPIRRVVMGAFGVLQSGGAEKPSGGSSCCGPRGGCD